MKNAAVAYLDMQDPRCHTLAGFLARAARSWGWPTAPATLADFAERLEDMKGRGRTAVLCVDEFEELIARRGEFNRDFLLSLRSCSQQRWVAIVTAAQAPLSELTDASDPTSPFYNTFPLLGLGPFTGEDAEDFVNLRRPGAAPFSPDARAAVLRFARGHPLALQVACFHVLEARRGGGLWEEGLGPASEDMAAHSRDWQGSSR